VKVSRLGHVNPPPKCIDGVRSGGVLCFPGTSPAAVVDPGEPRRPPVEDQLAVHLQLPGVEPAPDGDLMADQVSRYHLPETVALPGDRAEIGHMVGKQQQQLLFPGIDGP